MHAHHVRSHRIRGHQTSERGYTLTEILVVIVILGILAAIAIPLFLMQRQKAFRATLQADLRNAASALDDAAAAHEGDYTATGIPLDTILDPTTPVVGMGAVGSSGGRAAASVTSAATTLSFRSSPNVVVWIETMSTTTYCMNAKHSSMTTIWSFDRTRGVAVEGGCSSSSAVPSPPPATPDPSTSSSTSGGAGGGGAATCDPKDTQCLAQAEADALGCKIDDTTCLDEGRKKAAIEEAKKYGCQVGDTECIADGKKKAAAEEAAAEAEKYGCKVGDVDCLNAAKEKEAAQAAESAITPKTG